MMTMASRIESDYLAAYKAKETVRLNVLRLLKSALKNLQVEKKRELTDAEILTVISQQCKQRIDSSEQYVRAGRLELAAQEDAELKILQDYMPELLTDEELSVAVHEAVAETDAVTMRDMSRVMQHLLTAHPGRIDGKKASEAVKAALQG